MKPLAIKDSETVVLGLQDEIRRSENSRYDHRLHGLLLVAQGMSCRHVAELLGDSPRTVAYWVRRFEINGLAGLTEDGKSGRPRRLNDEQIETIDAALQMTPTDFGFSGKPMGREDFIRICEAQMGYKSWDTSVPAALSSTGISSKETKAFNCKSRC